MGGILFVFGVLALIGGVLGMLMLPAVMLDYASPLVIVGGVWIAAGGTIERIDMLRTQIKNRP